MPDEGSRSAARSSSRGQAMSEPVRRVSDPRSDDELSRLREFVERVGGIEAARGLLETLGDLLPADGEAGIDLDHLDLEALEGLDLEDADDEDADGDAEQAAA